MRNFGNPILVPFRRRRDPFVNRLKTDTQYRHKFKHRVACYTNNKNTKTPTDSVIEASGTVHGSSVNLFGGSCVGHRKCVAVVKFGIHLIVSSIRDCACDRLLVSMRVPLVRFEANTTI